MVACSSRLVVAGALVAMAACGSGTNAPGSDAGDARTPEAAALDTAEVPADGSGDGHPETRDGGYSTDGPCTPGVPRCHGEFGYQMCEQDGTWSESHNCEGYSTNGTTSYCAEIPMDTGDTWATCVDPACWYWLKRGAPAGATSVGICQPDGTINKCSSGGTLMAATCEGVCTRVATLDSRPLGYCAAVCAEGARECLGGPFYRTCTHGRWSDTPSVCDGECVPLARGTTPDIRCGGKCDPGTSRCAADLGGTELCTPAGWTPDRTCMLGTCRPAGPQAQCEAECAEGQHACAFDGAGAERSCQAGRWKAETACAAGTTCRLSGDVALGCVPCVGPRPGGGNAFGAADSRCQETRLDTCGADNAWKEGAACAEGKACVELGRGVSRIAACQVK